MDIPQGMTQNRYSMSFTSGTLLRRETLLIAELFEESNNWGTLREKVITENLLQMRTLSASKRIFSEVKSRLKQLSPDQHDLLLNSTYLEQGYLLWLAFCRRYRFIHDFATGVIREKFLRLDYNLTYDDYDVFFNRKAEWHPEMERVSPVTVTKQKQFVFKIMREAGLLSDDNQIIPAMMPARLVNVIVQDIPADLTVFPISDLDIENWTT